MNQRIELLDFWRSLCLLIMVAFHLCYDLALFGVIPMDVMTSLPARLIAYDVGGCFIFISGICLRFSREPVRRGFVIFCAGALVTAVTALLELLDERKTVYNVADIEQRLGDENHGERRMGGKKRNGGKDCRRGWRQGRGRDSRRHLR